MPLAPDLTGSAIDQPTRADSLPEPIAADAIPQPIGQVPPPPPQPPSWDELQVALKNIGDEDKSHAVEAWRDNVSRYGYEKTAWSQDDEDRLQRFADEEQKKIASEVKFESGDKLYKQLANDFLTDPMRPGDALIQAYRDGVINRADNEQLKSAFEIQDQMRMQAEEQRLAGGSQKLKAVGVGAGRGLAFAAGAVGGAKVAAFGTALIPVVGETVVAPIAAGLVGGAIGGTITAAGYDELVRSNFESAMAASKLNPNYTAAGELGAFVIPGIAGVAKGIKRFALVAENLGRKEALNQAAKYVAVSGGIGAASAPVMSAIDRWKNSALDLGHEPQADLLDPKSIVANTVLAIMLGNLGVKFTKFNAGEAASIHQRGMAGQKLSPAEREMFDTINRKMAQNPNSFVFEAEQATFRNPKTGEQMPMSGAGAARTQRNSAQPQQPAGAQGGAVPPPAGGGAPPPRQGAPPPQQSAPPPQQGRQQQQTGGQPPPPQTRAAPRRFNSQQEFNDFMDAASNRGDSVAGGSAWRTANVMGEKRWLPNWIKTNAQNNERSWFANSVLNAKSNADHATFVVQQRSAASAKAAPKASAAAAGRASPPPVAGVPGGQQGRPRGVPGVPRGGAPVVAAESAVPIAETPKTTAALARTVVQIPSAIQSPQSITVTPPTITPPTVTPLNAAAPISIEFKRGDRFKDTDGNEFEVWMNRQGTVEAHPVVEGKAQAYREYSQYFSITNEAKARNPKNRTDLLESAPSAVATTTTTVPEVAVPAALAPAAQEPALVTESVSSADILKQRETRAESIREFLKTTSKEDAKLAEKELEMEEANISLLRDELAKQPDLAAPAFAAQAPAPAAKAMTRSEINERIAVLLKAPAKAGGKSRVSFKTQAEEASFRRGFEAANKKPGEPPPEQLPGVPAKEQKIYDAFSQGWSQAQIAIRSLNQPTPAPAPAAQAPAASAAPEVAPPAAPVPAPVVESVSSADAKAKQKKEQRDMFDEEFPPEGFRSFGGISMDEIFSAASKLYKAGMDFAGWAANMLKKLGEKIAPILRRIWRSLTGQDIKPEFRESGAIFGAGRRRRGRQPDALPQEERLLTTQGFYEGSADVFLKKPLFKFLGKAINKQVDLADKRLGDTTGKLEAWESRTGGAAQKEAKATLSDYIDARESGRTADAANILSSASPAATDLIKTIGEIAKYTGRVSTTLVQPNGRIGVEVVAAGGIRKLVNMGDKFWPRILKGNYDAVLRDPLSDPVMWQEMVTDLIANGNIATPAEAEQFLKGGSSNDAESDFLGSLYKGRAKERMPAKWYDTSLEGFEDWAVKWSDIVSKIEAFGQKIRPNDTNQFDEALKLTTFAPTQSFINSVASRAYNERNVGTAARYLLDAPRLLASGLFLTNPVTIGINALSSKVMNTFTYGLAANFARNPLAMFSKNNNLDAFALGVLKRDMVRLLYRDDVPGLDALKNFTNGAMTISGYRSVENLTRVDSYLTALAFLHDGLGAVRRKPDSNAAMQFMAFVKRNGYDTAAIVRENGTGDATDTFLRGTIRDTQGGYAYNQVPWWTDTPLGRFMLQFSKFSTMFTRNVMRNVIEPAFVGTRVTVKVGGKTVSKRVFNVRPLLYFLLGSTLGGEAISFLKEKAFGIERRDATLEEIANTMDESTRDGLVLIAKRVVNDMLTMGMLGIFGTPIQSVKDVSEQTKMRNPLSPPGVSLATNIGGLIQSGFEQGKLTPEDVGDFLKSSVSMYRYGDAFVKEQSQNAGMEWESAQLKSRRDDAAFIRAASKRYAAEAGLPLGRATSAGRTAKSETTPMRRDLMDSLMTGNEGDARKTVTDYLSEFPSIAEKKEKLRSLQASVAQNQPVKVGGIAGNERRIEFMAWAKKNLSIADVARIEAIDQNYRKTANAIGLMTVPTAYQDERQSLKTAREIEKKEVKATEDENAEFFERNLKPQYKRRTQGMRLGL